MEYSSPSNGAVIAAYSETSPKQSPTVTLFPVDKQNSIDPASRLALIAKAFQSHHHHQQLRTQIISNHNRMTSNISNILQSNIPSGLPTIIVDSVSPLGRLANIGGGGGASGIGIGISGQLPAINASAMMANVSVATSPQRPLKRAKIERDDEQGDGNTAFPPVSSVLIPSQLHHRHHLEQLYQGQQKQLAEYSSEQSHGDDTESRESLGRPTTPGSNHHHQQQQQEQEQQQDGASSGVRFREYQAEIWSEKFEELCLFRREHGHCHVPHQFQENQGEYYSLGGRMGFGSLFCKSISTNSVRFVLVCT
jgi:hypothetical protein